MPQAAADYSPFWIDFPCHWILFAGVISLGFFRNWTYHLRSAGMDWISLYCGFIPPHTRRTHYLRNFCPLNLSPPASRLNNALRNKSENPCGLLVLPIQHSSTGKAAQFAHRELHEWLLPAARGTPALPCHGAPVPRQCPAGAPWWEGVGGRTDRRRDSWAVKPLTHTAQQEIKVSVVLSEGIDLVNNPRIIFSLRTKI